jgi:protein-tyrosine phosphatase
VTARLIALEGAQNFRDLGGYPTRDGGVTRWRTVFRTDALHQLTSNDLQLFGELGVMVVYDLRRDSELVTRPNQVSTRHFNMLAPVDAAGVEQLDRTALEDQPGGEGLLRDMYRKMLDHSGSAIGSVVAGLADADALPAAFNCHAGKDRTGLVAALVLEAIGVDRQIVLDDYELTTTYRTQDHRDDSYERLIDMGLVPEAALGVLGTPRWTMADTLDDLDHVHGGIERYLEANCGVGPETLSLLRTNLVDY